MKIICVPGTNVHIDLEKLDVIGEIVCSAPCWDSKGRMSYKLVVNGESVMISKPINYIKRYVSYRGIFGMGVRDNPLFDEGMANGYEYPDYGVEWEKFVDERAELLGMWVDYELVDNAR